MVETACARAFVLQAPNFSTNKKKLAKRKIQNKYDVHPVTQGKWKL